MKLTKKDVGCKFNTDSDLAPVVTCVHACTGEGVFLFEETKSRSVMLTASDGYSLKSGSNVTSRHDPRSWLTEMPNLGDIKEGWIACDMDREWYWYLIEPTQKSRGWSNESASRPIELGMFNMPTLAGDQWKDSLISVAELK